VFIHRGVSSCGNFFLGRPGSTAAVGTDQRGRHPDQHRDQIRLQDHRIHHLRGRVRRHPAGLVLVKTGQDGQRVVYFRADKAWWYITLLTIGYMIARGLAKSGSRQPYEDNRR
jgi:hypothetical protein